MPLSKRLAAWLDRTVTIESEGAVAQNADRYGNTAPEWGNARTVKGRIERARNLEDAERGDREGRDTSVLAWFVYLNTVDTAGVVFALDRTDRLTIDGQVYSPVVVEQLTRPNGTASHYEVLCQEVT